MIKTITFNDDKTHYDTLECTRYGCDKMVKPCRVTKEGIVKYKCKCSHEFAIDINGDISE